MQTLVPLVSLTTTIPSRCKLLTSTSSSLDSLSSSIWSVKSKAFAYAPGIAPTSLSLKDILVAFEGPKLSGKGESSLDRSLDLALNPAWCQSLTFLLLQASLASSSLESVLDHNKLITQKSPTKLFLGAKWKRKENKVGSWALTVSYLPLSFVKERSRN
ncbi:hypothetical protein CMV_001139 [Castanea mollissima]|uniref:Uncharacterized protein n=1 Tax=Castanea mollissima TaxID=60419 RepID=A0A8J4S0Q8_9ROSI|nr:hypothetical protein CMV_001139 [Castanea mollissima]